MTLDDSNGSNECKGTEGDIIGRRFLYLYIFICTVKEFYPKTKVLQKPFQVKTRGQASEARVG